MTVKDDGSLGVWGGKKYEGLGIQNVNLYLIFFRNLLLLEENKVWTIIIVHISKM